MTLAPVAERLAVELSLPVLIVMSVAAAWDSNIQPTAFGANALTHCATVVVFCVYEQRQRVGCV